MSLVDNPQETFGLAVAEAMAAGLPLVVSDWNGYRDLVRDGLDGFRVSTRWSSVAQQASAPLGWQQLLTLQPFPKVAGALGQLVHVDTQAAEAACLTLLTSSELRRAMGAAARKRACETFHPDVVMSQIEALFLDLQARRQLASMSPASPSPQLDLVRTFTCYATPGNAGSMSQQDSETGSPIPPPVRAFRELLWDLLQESLPKESHDELWAEIMRKHSHHKI